MSNSAETNEEKTIEQTTQDPAHATVEPTPRKRKGAQPNNLNAFRHGLAAIEQQRLKGQISYADKKVKTQVLQGLIADKGTDLSTSQRVLAELISDDTAWLTVLNKAISRIVRLNPKVASNPKALAKLDSYRRPVMASLAANVARFGLEKQSGKGLKEIEAYGNQEQEQEEKE